MTGQSETGLTTEERWMLHAFQHSIDEGDWDYVPAHYVMGGPVTKADRAVIKRLRLAGLMDFSRGGMDDDGRLIGGTFYGITEIGRGALLLATSPTP